MICVYVLAESLITLELLALKLCELLFKLLSEKIKMLFVLFHFPCEHLVRCQRWCSSIEPLEAVSHLVDKLEISLYQVKRLHVSNLPVEADQAALNLGNLLHRLLVVVLLQLLQGAQFCFQGFEGKILSLHNFLLVFQRLLLHRKLVLVLHGLPALCSKLLALLFDDALRLEQLFVY